MFILLAFCHLTFALGEWASSAVEDVHKALITEAAVLPKELMRRGIATCAYVSGNPASPLTCASGYNCIETIQDRLAFACCDQIQCLDDWRLCANFGAPLCGVDLSGEECSAIYTSILSCSSENPYCFTYARSSALGDYNTYYSLACGPSSTPTVVLALAGTTSDGGDSGGAAATSQTQSQNTGTGTADTVIYVTQMPTTAAAQNPPNGTSSGSSLSLAAIIAIAVVVGLVVLAIISCVSCFMWKHHQRKTAEAKSPTGPTNIPYQPTNPAHSVIANWNNNVVNGPPAPRSEYPMSDFGGSDPPPYLRDSRRPSNLWSH